MSMIFRCELCGSNRAEHEENDKDCTIAQLKEALAIEKSKTAELEAELHKFRKGEVYQQGVMDGERHVNFQTECSLIDEKSKTAKMRELLDQVSKCIKHGYVIPSWLQGKIIDTLAESGEEK